MSRTVEQVRHERDARVDRIIAEVRAQVEREGTNRERIDRGPNRGQPRKPETRRRPRAKRDTCTRCSSPVTQARCATCGHVVRKQRRT